MTITNNAIQSVLLTPDVSVDGVLTDAVQLPNALQGQTGESAGEGEFWTLLSQNLAEVVEDGDAQTIENKEILSALKAFEAQLEGQQGELLPAQWMQFLKSHFKELLNPQTGGQDLPIDETQLSALLDQLTVTDDAATEVAQLPANPLL